MNTRRLIRIGFFFAGSLIILFWGLNILKGRNLFQTEQNYFARYEKIGGLIVSSPVTLHGLKVGEVREIKLSDQRYDEILVQFAISYPDLTIPKGTIPRIYSTDLMGTKGIELVLTDSLAKYNLGDTLLGTIEGDLKDQVNTQMLPLKRKAEDLMSSMDSVLIALHLVFDQENRSNLSQSFQIVAQTLKNFEQTSVFLDTFVKAESNKFSYILSNLDSLSVGLVSRTGELQNTLLNLGHFTDSLRQIPLRDAVMQFSKVLDEVNIVLNRVNQGEGSLGKFIMEDSLYYAIESVSYSLNNLLEDIRKNPRRYVSVSGIDRGKTIVVSNDETLLSALTDEIDEEFYVCLTQTGAPLPKDHSIFREFRKIESILVGNQYFYYILITSKYDKARRLVSKHAQAYPEASIYARIKGQWREISF